MTATAVSAPPARLDAPDLVGYPQFLRPAVAAPGVYYAGFWIRVGVNLVDSAIQAVLYLVVSYLVSAIVGIIGSLAHFDSNATSVPVAVICIAAVYIYYCTVLVARSAATPGMRIASMRIVSDVDIAVAPERRRLYLRGIVWILFSATGVLRIVDTLFIAVDPRKRSLHDVIAHTVVVRRAPPPPRLQTLLCSECGRPVDEGTLCPRHGGSRGLAITLSGHTVSLQVAAAVLAVTGVAGVVVGIVLAVSGRPAGLAGVVAGIALLRVTMSLTQLRSWARIAGAVVGVDIAVAGVVGGAVEISQSNHSGGFLIAGGIAGAIIAACLWTPETYRSFRRVP